MIGPGVSPVVLSWLALLFPIPTPPGGQSSPNLSAGSSIAWQVQHWESVGSLLILGLGTLFCAPWADYSLVAPHSTLTLIYRCGYPARFHLGSPWRLFCGVPTASHPHPWLVPYLDGTDTRDFCLVVVFPYVP